MTLTGNNVITLRKLTSKVTAEKGIPLLKMLIIHLFFYLRVVILVSFIRLLDNKT